MVEDWIFAVVLDPGVWGFVEFEVDKVAAVFSELRIEGVPENMDETFGCGVGIDGGVKIVVIIGSIKLALHEELKIPEIEEEPLTMPDVGKDKGSGDCDLKYVSMSVVSRTFPSMSFQAVGGVEGESSCDCEHVIWFS